MKQLILFAFLSLALNGESQSWVSATPYADPNNKVNDIQVHNGDIYIGGAFNQVGGIVSENVAKWDGNVWSAVGNAGLFGFSSEGVTKLISSNGELYAIYNNNLFWLDAGFWEPMLSYAHIYGIDNYGSEMIVSTDEGILVGNLNSYTNLQFYAPDQPSFRAVCFKEYNGELYVGGTYPSGLYKYDSTNWWWTDITGVTVGNVDIEHLEVFQNKLLIAGDFSTIGGLSINDIAYYDGVNYSSLGNPFSFGTVNDMEVQGNQVYFGGLFFYNNYNTVWRFDGLNWYEVDDNYQGSNAGFSRDIEFVNSELYSCGDNTDWDVINGIYPKYFLKFNGSLSSIENHNNQLTTNINLFPNPTSDQITIDIKGYNGDVNIEVYDLQGRLLETTTNTIVSLKKHAKGIYVLKISYGEITEEVRVVRD